MHSLYHIPLTDAQSVPYTTNRCTVCTIYHKQMHSLYHIPLTDAVCTIYLKYTINATKHITKICSCKAKIFLPLGHDLNFHYTDMYNYQSSIMFNKFHRHYPTLYVATVNIEIEEQILVLHWKFG